jgi:hypothetical protein
VYAGDDCRCEVCEIEGAASKGVVIGGSGFAVSLAPTATRLASENLNTVPEGAGALNEGLEEAAWAPLVWVEDDVKESQK